MIDIHHVKAHPDEVAENCRRRRVKVDVPAILAKYEERTKLQQELDGIRRRQNEVSQAMKGAKSKEQREPLIAEGRELKERVATVEKAHDEAREAFETEFRRLPNLTHPDSPLGDTDADNKEIRQWTKPGLKKGGQDHVQIGKRLGLIDFEGGGKVAGSGFFFLKDEAVLLELGMVRMALEMLRGEGFSLYETPDVARPKILEGIGFNPRGAETQIYSIADQDLCLIGTAEITLGGLHADEILDGAALPMKLGGVSHCFRTEAGAAGRESKGLYRVHQFTKVEMFAFTRPEDSAATHEYFVGLEERFFQMLEIPYRVVDICTGDLGGPAYRKYDIEAWMPGRGQAGEWGEVTSASNCTDYQARRLNIRFRRDKDAKPEFVHMLNGTACAVSRALLSLLENHQQDDGSVRIPEALRKYVGFDRVGG